jgi:hypothetical protein
MVTRLARLLPVVALGACQSGGPGHLVFPEGMLRSPTASAAVAAVPGAAPGVARGAAPGAAPGTAPSAAPGAARARPEAPPQGSATSATPAGAAAATPPPAKAAATPAATAPAAAPRGGRTGYVLRLAESGRVWELELPEDGGGYEVRIPLGPSGPAEMLTPADEEILADVRAREGAEAAAAPVDAKAAAARKSYLGGLAKVSALYQTRRYELALVEVVNLESAYPRDGRVLAMKGSLYLKLGKKRLAREAWQKALAVNPSDAGVAEALRDLGAAEE